MARPGRRRRARAGGGQLARRGQEPECLWLPPAYRPQGTSEYVQGVEAPWDRPVPAGFDAVELPEAAYLRFRGEPFADEDYGEAIEALRAVIDGYDPAELGYAWDDTHPRIQLAPVGERGYIELRAVRKLE